jgi:hypothetical protein
VAVSQQRTITTRVVAVQVTSLSEDQATASLTAEQVSRSVDATAGQLVEESVVQQVACRLVREGGQWLVAEFRLLSEERQLPEGQD